MPSPDEAQGFFDFGHVAPARRRRPERLFFACLPDRGRAGHIHRIGQRVLRELDFGGRSLPPERLHVSLHHIGDFDWLPARILNAAERAAGAVRMRRFEMTFRWIRSFGARSPQSGPSRARPLVLLGEGAGPLELHRLLAAAMREQGLGPSPAIVPHMTLAYGFADVDTRKIDPIGLAFDAFRLVHSERGRRRYHILGSWPLGTSAAARLDLNLA